MRAGFVLLPLLMVVTLPLDAQWPPERLENLQVLPEDIAVRDLVTLMAGFTRALGVRCTHCHVGEEGRPISSYDFPSDDKLAKRKAREMLRMVQAINGQHLRNLEERNDPPVEVECATCHRGVTAPRQLQDVLLLAYDAGGLDSTQVVYRALRERYYGRAAYDFGEVALADVAEALEERGQAADALAIHETNVEFSPASTFAQRMHARASVALAFEGGIETGTTAYHELRNRYGEDAFPEWLLNGLGYSMLRRGETAEAIAVFTLNVEAFPASSNVYDSLGEGYMTAGDVAKAIENYERSLQLDPENANAVAKLEELRRRGR